MRTASRFLHIITSLLTPAVLREMQSVPFSQPRSWNVQYLLSKRKGGIAFFKLCALIYGNHWGGKALGRHRSSGNFRATQGSWANSSLYWIFSAWPEGYLTTDKTKLFCTMILHRMPSASMIFTRTLVHLSQPVLDCQWNHGLAAARPTEDLLCFCAFREARRLLQFPGSLVSLTSQGH